MAANIVSLAPSRARAGASLVLAGNGFAAAGNVVTVDGLAATVTAEDSASITVTVPAGVRTDRFVPVVVTNPDDTSESTRQWWSKATAAELQAFLLAFQLPGEFEDWGEASSDEHPQQIEAKDIETLNEHLQYLPTDLLTTPGDMAGRNDNGVGQIAAGADGATLTLDHATTGGGSGASQLERRPATLTWGRQLSDAVATLMSAHASSDQATTVGPEQRAPDGGRAVMIVAYVDSQGGTRKLDQIEVLVDGVVVHDSGAGLAVVAQGRYVANVWADVGALAATDRLSVRITGDAGTSSLDVLATLTVF